MQIPTNISNLSVQIKGISMYDIGQEKSSIINDKKQGNESKDDKSLLRQNNKQNSTPPKKSISGSVLRRSDPSRIHSRRIPKSKFTHLNQLFSTKQQIRHYYQSKQRQASKENEENLCLVCVNKCSDAVFMPCGHGGICYECSLDLWKKTGECYLCRNEINSVLQIDLQNTFGEYLKVISETYLETNQPPATNELQENLNVLESSQLDEIQEIDQEN